MSERPRLLATLEGYAVEGGFDGRYEPATCYAPTIALGRHAGPGPGEGLWTSYERVLDVVPTLGLDGVRLNVEWARVEPRKGVYDVEALDRYAQVVDYALSRDLHVTVALVDAVWPAWLGLEAWLLPWVVPYVLDNARRVAAHVDERAAIIAFTSPADLIERGFLIGSAPPWRSRALDDAQSAYRQIVSILDELCVDELVGPRLVGETSTIPLDLEPADIRAALEGSVDCEEVYLRSLVQGVGPTSAAQGLLMRQNETWTSAVSDELLASLR